MNNGYETAYTIQGTYYQYMDDWEECSQYTFEQQWSHYLISHDFSECEQKCVPYGLPDYITEIIPVCNWAEEYDDLRNCTAREVYESWWNFKFRDKRYLRSCKVLQFKGTENNHAKVFTPYTTKFGYDFKTPNFHIAYDEFLIFDSIALGEIRYQDIKISILDTLFISSWLCWRYSWNLHWIFTQWIFHNFHVQHPG